MGTGGQDEGRGRVEVWRLLIVVGGCAALTARVMSLWSGFPPPRDRSVRAKVASWVLFAVATGLTSVFVYVVWQLRESTAA